MSLAKLKKGAHMRYLAEAKEQGVKTNQVKHIAMFSGHLHYDHYEDLGVIKHFIIPSLSPSDSWHKENGYVGSKEEASIYIFDKKEGRKLVIYS